MASSLVPVAASLAAIVILILVLGALLRRMPGAGRSSSALKIRAALAVGTRERVVWIEAGGKHLLVGVAQGSVRTLMELPEPPADPAGAPQVPNFRDLLHRAWGGGSSP